MKKLMQEHKEVVQGIIVVVGVILAIVILFFVSENTGDRTNDKAISEQNDTSQSVNPLLEEGQELDEEKMKAVEEITMDDLKAYLKKKKTTTVIMLGYDSCYWCQQQKPILESLMYEKNLDVKYLKVDGEHLSEDDYNYLTGLHEDLENFGTPTFISVQNKKVQKVSPNAKTKTQLLEMFQDMGILE